MTTNLAIFFCSANKRCHDTDNRTHSTTYQHIKPPKSNPLNVPLATLTFINWHQMSFIRRGCVYLYVRDLFE